MKQIQKWLPLAAAASLLLLLAWPAAPHHGLAWADATRKVGQARNIMYWMTSSGRPVSVFDSAVRVFLEDHAGSRSDIYRFPPGSIFDYCTKFPGQENVWLTNYSTGNSSQESHILVDHHEKSSHWRTIKLLGSESLPPEAEQVATWRIRTFHDFMVLAKNPKPLGIRQLGPYLTEGFEIPLDSLSPAELRGYVPTGNPLPRFARIWLDRRQFMPKELEIHLAGGTVNYFHNIAWNIPEQEKPLIPEEYPGYSRKEQDGGFKAGLSGSRFRPDIPVAFFDGGGTWAGSGGTIEELLLLKGYGRYDDTSAGKTMLLRGLLKPGTHERLLRTGGKGTLRLGGTKLECLVWEPPEQPGKRFFQADLTGLGLTPAGFWQKYLDTPPPASASNRTIHPPGATAGKSSSRRSGTE